MQAAPPGKIDQLADLTSAREQLAPLFPSCHVLNEPRQELPKTAAQQEIERLLYTDDEYALKLFPWRDGRMRFPLSAPLVEGAVHDIRGRRDCGGHAEAVPIFLITSDRMTVLKETMRLLHESVLTPFEIVIFDTGSTFPGTRAFLRELAEAGVSVYTYHAPKCTVARYCEIKKIVNRLNKFVASYLGARPNVSHYVISDPDVGLMDTSANGDIMHLYAAIIQATGTFPIGPALMMDDIPRNTHFYRHPGYEVKSWYANNRYAWVQWLQTGSFLVCTTCKVDTTFAMYPRNKRIKRIRGMRVLAPYAARHLDFYMYVEALPPDVVHYHCAASKTGHGTSHTLGGLPGFDVKARCKDFVLPKPFGVRLRGGDGIPVANGRHAMEMYLAAMGLSGQVSLPEDGLLDGPFEVSFSYTTELSLFMEVAQEVQLLLCEESGDGKCAQLDVETVPDVVNVLLEPADRAVFAVAVRRTRTLLRG